MSTRYAVTIDVPAGISRGRTFDRLDEADDYFGEVRRGTSPNGTLVRLIEIREGYKPGRTVLDTWTIER